MAFQLWAFALIALVAGASANFHNVDVKRTIVASGHIVRVDTAITARADKAVSKYTLSFPESEAKYLASVEVEDDKGKEIPVSKASSSESGFVNYIATFPKAIPSGTTVSFNVLTAFPHLMVPYPKEITQLEDQLVELEVNAYFTSPYATSDQVTTVNLGSSRVESYTKVEPSSKETSSIVYGHYEGVEPYTVSMARIHFKNNSPFVTFTTVEREIEVSHWGNVAVEEHYDLENTGAALKGGFSRVDYQMKSAKSNSLASLDATLIGSATDIYYRDIIGNISTSNVRQAHGAVEFEIRPRFPVFGGWKTQWYQGYNVPSKDVLEHDGSDFRLTFDVNVPFPDVVIDNYLLRIILPEHSTDIKVTTPFPMDQSESKRFTYLDSPTAGRPVIVLNAKNVVSDMSGQIVVEYKFPTSAVLFEPALLVGAFFAVFLSVSILSRLNLSIMKKKSD